MFNRAVPKQTTDGMTAQNTVQSLQWLDYALTSLPLESLLNSSQLDFTPLQTHFSTMLSETDSNSLQVKPDTKKPMPKNLFTTDNAREMSARSVIARLKRKQERDLGLEPIPLLPDERYRLLTLSRVRKQLDQLFRDAEKANEVQKDRISSAISRLVTVERVLACSSTQNQSSTSRQKPPEVV